MKILPTFALALWTIAAGCTSLFAQTEPATRSLPAAPTARLRLLPQMIAGSADPEETLDAYFNGLADNEIVTAENWQLIRQYGITKEGTTVQKFLEHRGEFAATFGTAAVDTQLYKVYSREVEAEDPTHDKNMLELKAEIASLNFKGGSILCDRLEVIRLKEAEDFDALTRLVSGNYFGSPAMPRESADMLFKTAQNFACSRAPERMDFAALCAAKSYELHPTYEARAEHAQILIRQKKMELALTVADDAVANGNKLGANTLELEAILAEIRGNAKATQAFGFTVQDGYVEFVFDPIQYVYAQDEFGGGVSPVKDLQIETVSVVGDFNDWRSGTWELVKDGNRYLMRKEVAAFAKKKEWAFRFIINGKYQVAPPLTASNKRIKYEDCSILREMSLVLSL